MELTELNLEPKETVKERLEVVTGQILKKAPLHIQFMANPFLATYLHSASDEDMETNTAQALAAVEEIIAYIKG